MFCILYIKLYVLYKAMLCYRDLFLNCLCFRLVSIYVGFSGDCSNSIGSFSYISDSSMVTSAYYCRFEKLLVLR